MLKSLFEASIDRLNIPADMKDAIKKINNICLEAEGQETDPSKQYNYEAYPKGKSIMKEDSDERVAAQKKDAEAKKNGQEKDTSVKGVDPDVEKIAKNGWKYDASEDVKKNDKEDDKTAKEEKEEKKKEDSKEESKEEDKAEDNKEEQSAQNSEPEENKGTPIAKGTTREPSQVRTSGPASSEPNNANAQATPKAAPKYRADVATVQFFLRATEPHTNLVGDGILGPKTITAIQQTEDIKPTGKMDPKTQEAFNKLLAEAKQKVIPIQKQLGVTADGLIGKQTLTAMQKANMNVAGIFGASVGAPTQVANNQGGNANNATNVLANKFNEANAQRLMKSNVISQQEYNVWKQYGIAPIYQRQNPQAVQTQIAAAQKKQQEANAGSNVPKGGQQTALTTNGPRNDAEKKFFDQTKQNYIKVYSADKNTPQNMIIEKADQAARVALAKKQKGEWAKEGQAALDNVVANMGNNNQTQNAAQPQQQAQQQQQAAQPQQQAQPQQAPQQQQAQQQNQKQPQGSTQYLSGKISYMNLPPDEKKVYDDTEKKALAEYIKKGNNEQTAYNKAQMNAQVAVLRYRQKKGNKG